MTPPSPTVEPFGRALDFVRAGVTRIADEVRPIEAGVVITTPSLPAVWAINQLRITEPLGFDAVIELADREQVGSRYRHIAVEDQGSGPELEAAFRRAGWKTERELWMGLAEEPDRVTDVSRVVDAEEDEAIGIMRRWHAEDELASNPDELRQLVEFSRREARALVDRLLGVRSGDGQLVAITQLRTDGVVAQVEDVYTVPEARGRGHARALVTRAIELARDPGHDLIFITADDEDWPKQLYAQVGFRPLGHLWQFHRG